MEQEGMDQAPNKLVQVEHDSFTEDEITELEIQRADHLTGRSKSYSADESIRMVREGFKGLKEPNTGIA